MSTKSEINECLQTKNPVNSENPGKRSWFTLINLPLIILLLMVVISCGGDGSTTGPDPDPDPAQSVSFSEDIEPIFNGSCAVSGCHNSSTQNSGVNLSSYSDAINSVGNQYDMEIIEPGEPESSPIVDKISNDNPKFGARMPRAGSALSDAQIDSIVAWIDDGAPDN